MEKRFCYPFAVHLLGCQEDGGVNALLEGRPGGERD